MEIEDGLYLVEPKRDLKYLGEKTIVKILNAKKYPDDCVEIFYAEKEFSLKDIKIIKKLDIEKL